MEAGCDSLLCRQDPCLIGVISQGENGFEYTCEKDFLDAIDVMFENPEWRIAAGKRSEEKAAIFDRVTFGNTMEKIYNSVLHR